MKNKNYARDVSVLEQENLLNLAFTEIASKIRKIEKDFIKKSKLDITPRELLFLGYINEYPNENMNMISERLGITKSTFTLSANLLVKKMYIIKEKTSSFSFTELGKKGVALYFEIRKTLKDQILKLLSIEEYNQLINAGFKIWQGL